MPAPTYRTIYLLCPAKVRTGGPEALHQLGRSLRDLGHDARMVYASPDAEPEVRQGRLRFAEIADPRPDAYAHYRLPYTFEIEDDAANALVFPEVWPRILRSINNISPYMWWLSIDNGLGAVRDYGGFAAIGTVRCQHLCQSYYALSYLLERNIPGLPLFDYTARQYLESAAGTKRLDRILYPARGRWFTGWLRRWAPDLPWQEIAGFSPAEVRELFLTSKLYVDFGSHPGKDRMPREAAILGCCIMTGQRGAAANPFDVPLLARYKFRDSRLRIPGIIRAIRSVLGDYEHRIGDFSTYRRTIEGEKAEFDAQVFRVFGGRPEAARPSGESVDLAYQTAPPDHTTRPTTTSVSTADFSTTSG